jgi:hypothetical protein
MESRHETRRAVLLLCLLQAVSFTIFAFRIGFYSDDWNNLELALNSSGYWNAVRAFATKGSFIGFRLCQVLYFPLIFRIGGLHPAFYQFLLSSFNAAEAVLLFIFLKEILERPGLAFVATALAVIYPGRVPVHIWSTNSLQALTHVLLLASLVFHARWVKNKHTSNLLAGQFFYLWSLLCYESCAFMPLFLAGGLWAKHRDNGEGSLRALRLALTDLLPYTPSFLAGLGWQWFGVQRFFHGENPKASLLHPTFRHALEVYGLGLGCLTYSMAFVCGQAAKRMLGMVTGTVLILWSFCVYAAYGLIDQEPHGPVTRRTMRVATGLALGGFLGAYLPYALSSGYPPKCLGMLSRVNGAGAWSFGLAWAMALFWSASRGARLRRALLALVVGACTWTNWAIMQDWAAAWRLERQILAAQSRQAGSWPAHARITLKDATWRAGSAPVFAENWSFGPALRLYSGRQDITADVILNNDAAR